MKTLEEIEVWKTSEAMVSPDLRAGTVQYDQNRIMDNISVNINCIEDFSNPVYSRTRTGRLLREVMYWLTNDNYNLHSYRLSSWSWVPNNRATAYEYL
jgi:hypothetical protein